MISSIAFVSALFAVCSFRICTVASHYQRSLQSIWICRSSCHLQEKESSARGRAENTANQRNRVKEEGHYCADLTWDSLPGRRGLRTTPKVSSWCEIGVQEADCHPTALHKELRGCCLSRFPHIALHRPCSSRALCSTQAAALAPECTESYSSTAIIQCTNGINCKTHPLDRMWKTFAAG